MNRRTTGKNYEEIAADFLFQNGYSIIEKNFRSRRGEIDLIVADKTYIVFVEVKFRNSDFLSALYAVNAKKQRTIVKTALWYLQNNQISLQPRFDVISITIQNGKPEIEHYINAFRT